METVSHIRSLENEISKDIKAMNNIVTIKKYLKSQTESSVQMAAIHSLRRIFINLIDNGRMSVISKDTGMDNSLVEIRSWLIKQLQGFLDAMLGVINTSSEEIQGLIVRTILEFVKRDWKIHCSFSSEDTLMTNAKFGTGVFKQLLNSFLNSADECSAEVLIILQREVFCYHDCCFYTLETIGDTLTEKKDNKSDSSMTESVCNLVRNCIDIIRMISLPLDLEDNDQFLVDPSSSTSEDQILDDDSSDSDSDNDGASNGDTNQPPTDKNGLISVGKNKFTPQEYEVWLSLTGQQDKKRKSMSNNNNSSKKRRKPSTQRAKLTHMPSYHKVFSAVWLTLLSFPLSKNQHKLILNHLPDQVIDVMPQPLLLADYLTQSYNCGGIVAVLALESLFKLIVQHNLDYPQFFPSLYRLCTLEVFNAKYRSKFLTLLSASLKSQNLPAYLVAAFIKRLAQIALRAPTPAALFCVAEITWLLRKHSACMVLLHRLPSKSKPSTLTTPVFRDVYNPHEEHDIEKANALQSSLWELEILCEHQFHSVSSLANSLRNAESTSNDPNAPFLQLEDFVDHRYEEIMEEEVKKWKKFGALNHRHPSSMFESDSFLDRCFGV